MRRHVLALVSLVSLVAACGGEDAKPPVMPEPPPVATTPPPPTAEPAPTPAPAPKPSMAELQQQGLATALEGLNGHDPKKFASVYAEDAVITVAGLNEVRGREAIAQNMAEWFETFKSVKLGFSRVWVKDDTLVLEWVINGTHSGELFGVKGTEQPIGHYGLSIVQFNADGKVAKESRYGELGAVMTQIAGRKAKPRPIPPVPAKPEMIVAKEDTSKNVELAKAAHAALEGKKEADFLGALTDDIEHDGLFALETTKGKADAKKFFKDFTTAFPDAKFATSRALAIGDYVIAESVLEATHKGALGKIAATKKPIAIHIVDVFKLKDGKVARAWTYQNSLELQEQLGLFTVKAAGNVPASQQGKGAAKPEPKAAEKPAEKKGGGDHKGGGGGKGTGGGTGGGGGKGAGGGDKK